MFKRQLSKIVLATVIAGFVTGAASAESVKFAVIDGLSGPFAANGQNALREFQYAADILVNQKGGVADGNTFEFIGFDNKTSPKESLIQLENAISQGIRYIVQGNSSGVANAISVAVAKHNARNPDNQVVFFNHSAVDPALTNDKCNFWHFRFDGNADMKMNAITNAIVNRPDIKKIYLIGQNYSFGRAVAAAAHNYLAEKRPDIEIVGDELHPIGKVKDFSPYITKIMASGADAVITGNWGADMVNLARAANEAGLTADFFTYYAAGTGITATIGATGIDRIRVVNEGHRNPVMTDSWNTYLSGFDAKFPDNDLTYPRIVHTVEMVANAMNQASSTEPLQVALALEGMEHITMAGDKLVMRASDHQLQMPLQVTVHTNKDIVWDYDQSGFGLLTETSYSAEQVATETTCQMERPAQ